MAIDNSATNGPPDEGESVFERRIREHREKKAAEEAAARAEEETHTDLIPKLADEGLQYDNSFRDYIKNLDPIAAIDKLTTKFPKPTSHNGGDSNKFRCPWRQHDDDKESAWFNVRNSTWFCGSCYSGGDWIELAAAAFGYTVPGQTLKQVPGAFSKLMAELAVDFGWVDAVDPSDAAGVVAGDDRSDAASPTAHPTAPKPSGYVPVDIQALLDGGLEIKQPDILYRADDAKLFYRGEINSVIGESESGKTWMTLLAAYQLIRAEEHVLFIDFEDSPAQVLLRLLGMGITESELAKFFHYIQPAGAFGDIARAEFEGWIQDMAMVVIDGVTEAMSMHSLNGREENDIASFYAIMPKWIAARGPAVVMIDHVPKSKDNRGGYAIGSQHKKAGLTGASYTVENKDSMGRGHHGRSRISLAKDKIGGVSYLDGASDRWMGTLHVKSDGTKTQVWIDTVAITLITAGVAVAGMPTKDFERYKAITDYAKKLGKAVSKSTLALAPGAGRKTTAMENVSYLIDHGYLIQSGRIIAYFKDYDGSEHATESVPV